MQHGPHEDFCQHGNEYTRRQRYHGSVTHGIGGVVIVPLAQLQTEIGHAAVRDEGAYCQGYGNKGECNVGGGVAQIAHAPADKYLIDNVVYGVDHHGYDTWNGKLQQKLADRLPFKHKKPVFAVGFIH